LALARDIVHQIVAGGELPTDPLAAILAGTEDVGDKPPKPAVH
jgi:hypothetical protein